MKDEIEKINFVRGMIVDDKQRQLMQQIGLLTNGIIK